MSVSGTANLPKDREQCRLYIQGKCRSGANCKRSHELSPQGVATSSTPSTGTNVGKSGANASRNHRRQRQNAHTPTVSQPERADGSQPPALPPPPVATPVNPIPESTPKTDLRPQVNRSSVSGSSHVRTSGSQNISSIATPKPGADAHCNRPPRQRQNQRSGKQKQGQLDTPHLQNAKLPPTSPPAPPLPQVAAPVISIPGNKSSSDRTPHKRKSACRAWKAGACPRGSNCPYRHDVQTEVGGNLATGDKVAREPSAEKAARQVSSIEQLAREEHEARQARKKEEQEAREAHQARIMREQEAREAQQARIKREQEAREVQQARVKKEQEARKAEQARIKREQEVHKAQQSRLDEQKMREGQARQARIKEEEAELEAHEAYQAVLREQEAVLQDRKREYEVARQARIKEQEEEERQAMLREKEAVRQARIKEQEEEERQAVLRKQEAARQAKIKEQEEEERQAMLREQEAARQAKIKEQEEQERQARLREQETARQAKIKEQEEQERQARLREQEAARQERMKKQEEARQARLREQKAARQAKIKAQEEARQARLREQEAARQARIKEQEAAREAQRQAHIAQLAKEDAAKIIQRIVLGSIITFRAGLSISNLITGFESCIVRVKNLPLDASEEEVCAIFTQQGIDAGSFQIAGMKRMPGEKQEAEIITDAESGHSIAVGLDGIEFRDETLVFEVGTYNSPGSMSAAAARDIDVLTISWRAPSIRYIVEFTEDIPAIRKVQELNRQICLGRRVKVEMNSPPPGRFVASFRPNSIKISNLPWTVTEQNIVDFSGSPLVRRLEGRGYNVDHGIQQLHEDIKRVVAPGAVISFDQTSTSNSMDGNISVRVRFASWDEAQKAHTHLGDRRFPYIGNAVCWTRLQSPMHYTIVIPAEQYQAQKMQWASLVESIKDKKACILNILEQGNIVRVRVSGSVKPAIGALKVRVENLIAGEQVDGWHRSLGFSRNTFVRSVFDETGAYLRTDWRRQTLKVYGEPQAVERARELVKAQLEKLSSMEYTVFLKRQSISFFVRHGITTLKETIGEDNVRFNASSQQITVTGDEEARHVLSRLIDESLSEFHALPDPSSVTQSCPICYDDVSSPVLLGCGHIYCTACMRHFLASAVDSNQFPLTCLGDESQCGVPIPIPTIQRFLPPASFSRLLEVSFDSHVARHPLEFKYCRTPDCTQIYRSACSGEAAAMQCPSCFSSACAACHDDAHEGMSCEEFKIHRNPAEQERLNDEWISQQNGRVKKCPQCDVLIEKLEGCNHMECRCGAHVCWRCLGVFDPDTIYQHMHSAHGGIHGEDVVPEPVDFHIQQQVLLQAQLRQMELHREQVDEARIQQRRREAEQQLQRQRQEERVRAQRRQEQEERLRTLAREEYLQTQRRQEIENRLRAREGEMQAARLALRQQEQEQSKGWGCTIM